MITQISLEELTFSKKARKKILNHLPNARKHRKTHIAGCGYVYFISNEKGEKIAQCLIKIFIQPLSTLLI